MDSLCFAFWLVAVAIEAQQSDENEKGVIETLISNGLYFQVGGGLAQFKDDPYKNDNDITSLKYNIGISTQPFNFELGYLVFPMAMVLARRA